LAETTRGLERPTRPAIPNGPPPPCVWRKTRKKIKPIIKNGRILIRILKALTEPEAGSSMTIGKVFSVSGEAPKICRASTVLIFDSLRALKFVPSVLVAIKASPRTVRVSISPASTALTMSGSDASSTVGPELSRGMKKANVPKTMTAIIRDDFKEGIRCPFFSLVSFSGFTLVSLL
jgi:hypothetical protein